MINIRAALILASAFALSACGGGYGGNSSLPNNFGPCDPGTSVQIARPGPFQSGVSSSTNSIEIVANGSGNTLGNSFQNFDLILQANFGGSITSSPLSLTSDQSGPHPFGSDFFYSASIPGLQVGTTYEVFLNAFTSNCNPVAIGSFST